MLTIILTHPPSHTFIRMALFGVCAALFFACLFVTYVPRARKDRGGFYP